MSYDIECINTMPRSADYSAAAIAEYEQGLGDGIDKYTSQFETEHAATLAAAASDDIGGLIVYTKADRVVAVYDYENFCGWIL